MNGSLLRSTTLSYLKYDSGVKAQDQDQAQSHRQDERIKSMPLLILLHGRGAHEEDLFDLAPQFPQFRVLSVRAPNPYPLDQALSFTHSVYNDVMTQPKDLKQNVPEEASLSTLKSFSWYTSLDNGLTKGFEESLDQLAQFIEEMKKLYRVSSNQVFLLGFSQGASMSVGIALNHPRLTRGIIGLSGRLLEVSLPKKPDLEALSGFPIYLSYGLKDLIVPVSEGRLAQKKISQTFKVSLTYREFEVDHDVTDLNFEDAKAWILYQAFRQTSHQASQPNT